MITDFSKRPFIILVIPIIIGIITGKFFSFGNIALWAGLAFLSISVLLLIIKKDNKIATLLLLLSLVLLMDYRWESVHSLPENNVLFQDYKNIQSITGLVIQSKYKKENNNKYTLNLTKALTKNESIEVSGKVLLSTIKIKHRFKYGDLVNVNCKLFQPKSQRNPGQFDYKEYLNSEDIYLICYINQKDSIAVIKEKAGNDFIQLVIEPVKNHFNKVLETFITENNSPILKALLLGEKQDIETGLLEQFKDVGVVHVLAISGLHVGFIIIFVMIILSLLRLKYQHQIYVLLFVLLVFVILINFKAPVVRASLMAGLYFLAKLSERKISLLNIVFFVAFLLLIIDPRDLFNPGFQFSFSAVLAIVYGYPKLNNLIPLKSIFNFKNYGKIKKIFVIYVWDALLVSLAAVLGTLPLTVYYYGVIPTYALFANIIVIPLIGIIVMLGLLLVIVALFSTVFAAGLGNLINLAFKILKLIISFFYELPYSHFYSATPSILTILLFMILVYFIFNIKIRKHLISAIIVLILIMFMNLFSHKSKDALQVTFLDVGQGDASFIHYPNGESMLIDGGDATTKWDQGKNAILPFLKFNEIYSIKYAVASHPHNDHIGGLIEILKTIKVDTLVISKYRYNTKKYQNMIRTCRFNSIPIRYVGKGDMLYPDKNCRVYILHPPIDFVESNDYSGEECNNSSIVMKIQYGENGVLFTGDAEKEAELAYSNYGVFLESEIIKTGHHGSKTSSTQKLLGLVNPLAAVISVAERNKFRHPSPITMKKFSQNNIKPFLTSKSGAIQFNIMPDKISLIHWKNNTIRFY